MRMLKAGGIRLVGNVGPPLFEHPHCGAFLESDLDLLDRDDSWAIKALNPHICQPPHGPDYRWIWLSRNHKHQIRSQRKVSKWMSQALRRDFSITSWTKKGRRYIDQLGGEVLSLTFEGLLANPLRSAELIAAHVRHPVDPVAMASVVRERKPGCLPGMAEGTFQKGWGL